MKFIGLDINEKNLLSSKTLLLYLLRKGANDIVLGEIREYYFNNFGNELVWKYPISDGKHAGTFIVTVKDGFLSIPYNEISPEMYELLILDDAAMLDKESLQYFIDYMRLFYNDLMVALEDMKKSFE